MNCQRRNHISLLCSKSYISSNRKKRKREGVWKGEREKRRREEGRADKRGRKLGYVQKLYEENLGSYCRTQNKNFNNKE